MHEPSGQSSPRPASTPDSTAASSSQFIGSAVERELGAVVDASCPWQIEPGCATAERSAALREIGAADPIPVGTPVTFTSSLLVRTMVLTHMRQRAVVDPTGSDGAGILSYDIDLALVEEPG